MRKILDLPERICACGCARHFKPTRGNQRFFEAACRKKFYAEEMVWVRREDYEWLLSVAAVFESEQKRLGKLRAALEKK